MDGDIQQTRLFKALGRKQGRNLWEIRTFTSSSIYSGTVKATCRMNAQKRSEKILNFLLRQNLRFRVSPANQ